MRLCVSTTSEFVHGWILALLIARLNCTGRACITCHTCTRQGKGGRGPPMQRRGPVLEASWCEYRGSVNAQDGMSKGRWWQALRLASQRIHGECA
ncbi:hypothetical protein V8C43DRAFT_223172 [Trichoderma afarasin]